MEISNPWFRVFLTLDPSAFLSKVHVPVLAMNGSKDLQVPADANLSAVESALKAASNTSYRLLKLDGLNHLFQHAGSGLPAEYGKLTETFAPEALSAMRDFILGLSWGVPGCRVKVHSAARGRAAQLRENGG